MNIGISKNVALVSLVSHQKVELQLGLEMATFNKEFWFIYFLRETRETRETVRQTLNFIAYLDGILCRSSVSSFSKWATLSPNISAFT